MGLAHEKKSYLQEKANLFEIGSSVILGGICTVWIFSGGIRDALRLFRDLRTSRSDASDDGFVRQDETKS